MKREVRTCTHLAISQRPEDAKILQAPKSASEWLNNQAKPILALALLCGSSGTCTTVILVNYFLYKNPDACTHKGNERSGGICSHQHLRSPQPVRDICALKPKLSVVSTALWIPSPVADVYKVWKCSGAGTVGAPEPKVFFKFQLIFKLSAVVRHEKVCLQSLFYSTACKHLLEEKKKNMKDWVLPHQIGNISFLSFLNPWKICK